MNLALARGGVELRMFFREPEAVLGTFGSPVVLLLLLGMIFSEQIGMDESGAGGATVTAGIIALGVGSAAFVSLGIGVAYDRDNGALARLRQVPAPAWVYLAGKAILVLVTSLTAATVVLGTAMVTFGVMPPTQPGRWFTFAWVMLLGVAACALLGAAVSQLARTVRAANALMNLPFLVLAFLSGILVPISALPEDYRSIGAIFPFRWLGQGFRSVFLPDEMAAYEPAGTWEHGRIAVVLAAWCIGGLVLCLKTFRWRSPRDG